MSNGSAVQAFPSDVSGFLRSRQMFRVLATSKRFPLDVSGFLRCVIKNIIFYVRNTHPAYVKPDVSPAYFF